MPNAAIVAAALTDHSVRTFALWVGGVDMLKQPGAAGNLYGVPIDTIEVVENGPGGVSGLRCSIEDPLNVLPLPSAGQEVLFYDIADDHPEFLGFVQSITPKPHEGQQGRWLDLEAIGIEILLDWLIVPSLTLEAITLTGDNFQRAVAATSGSGQLRVALQKGGGHINGTQTLPIGNWVQGWVTIPNSSPVTFTGQTLRQMLRTIYDNADVYGTADPPNASPNITVDFTRGLRAWEGTEGFQPDDYVTLVVNDTAFTNTSSQLDYTVVPTDVVRAVIILGGSFYVGVFSDGSGIVGQEAVITDSSITNAAQAITVVRNYLGDFALQARGRLRLQNFNHGTTKYQAGSLLTITDAMVGLAAQTFRIGSITKHYNSNGSEEWDISFGGLVPSAMNSLRRLTRATLS